MLTFRDTRANAAELALIVTECELQHDLTPEALQGLAEALSFTKSAALMFIYGPIDPDDVIDLVVLLGQCVKPGLNDRGWRTTPASFGDKTQAVAPKQLARAMEQWAQLFARRLFETAEEAYYAFERIHPFADGNGRVGWLMWLIYHYMQTGIWLQELPPDFEFLQKRYSHSSDR